MVLSNEDLALFKHARDSLPRWVTTAPDSELEWLYAFVAIFAAARDKLQDWLDTTLISNASGVELDQHAADQGTSRRLLEEDVPLRERLRTVTDADTEPALTAGVNAILSAFFGAAVFTPAQIVNLRRDRAHFQSPGQSTAFFSRGYRMAYATRPNAYVVILPYGTTPPVTESVVEYLRQFGPGGFLAIVETRRIP